MESPRPALDQPRHKHCAWASLWRGRNADNDVKSAEMVHARYE
jgi:hypothetical protein